MTSRMPGGRFTGFVRKHSITRFESGSGTVGFYSDGEGHFFWTPELLKAKPPPGSARTHNPIARLRHELWAEFLNLPYPMAAPLLDDPVAASALFDRLPIHGNRFVPLGAIPQDLSLGVLNGGDSIVGLVLQALFSTIVNMDHQAIFDGVVDPTTQLEPHEHGFASGPWWNLQDWQPKK